ncbi:tubulin binding cofactor A [Hyaloscypha variabilis F]|uniref:Tubulin-specific chaperone A n=1 Tax=Hyaloscypha variabilis (strain UAMH 11265 / GT02V1 / F) TaxID=1149755 RepID=A0A2J6R2Q0_HYAVF|nr:tubulin binding cofactor A [Hyaloscypha variabilis F]
MAPPSALAIATGSVQRLVKEETSYHKELKNQETRLEKLVSSTEENENKEYQLKQERAAIEETKAVFPPLRQRITDALAKLEDQLEAGQASGASEEEVKKAQEVIALAKEATKKA